MGMWQITTVETQSDEPEELTFVVNSKPGEMIFVLIENLTGEGGIDARIDGAQIQDISNYNRVLAFIGRSSEQTKQISVRIWAAASQRLRLAIARLKKSVRESIDKLPCKVCKELAKAALSALLAYLGAHYLNGNSIALSHEQIKSLQDVPNDDGARLLSDLFSNIHSGLFTAIRTVIGALNYIFEFTDRLFEAICRILQMCP
jgi:hypothetical protein